MGLYWNPYGTRIMSDGAQAAVGYFFETIVSGSSLLWQSPEWALRPAYAPLAILDMEIFNKYKRCQDFFQGYVLISCWQQANQGDSY